MMRSAWCVCVVSAAAVAFGEISTNVTDAAFVDVTGYSASSTNEIIAVSEEVVGVPSAVTADKIAFHFDAKVRTGWEFAENDAAQIIKIPSLEGDRYLALSQDGGTGPSMSSYKGPTLALSDVLGDYVVDFGALAAKRGLCFNPANGENVLRNIGTIVAVYDSEDSGGFLMGGGYADNGGNPSAFKGRNWSRANNNVYGDGSGTPHYAGGMFDFRVTPGYGKPLIRHDGLMAQGADMGFNGGWEVFSYMPTETTMEYGLEANGIGICPYSTGYSGGMKIAEMYIFNCVIDRATVEKLEAYLERKWFGRTVRGYNGDTSVARIRQHQGYYTIGNTPTLVKVPEGSVLSVDVLQGGRGSGAELIKQDAGTLKVGTMKGYGGTLVLESGTLDLSRKAAIESEADFPRGLYAHFDANDPENSPMTTVEEDGKNLVTLWRSKVNVQFGGRPYVYLKPCADNTKYSPWVVTLPNGRKVLDFGGACGRSTTLQGRFMSFRWATDDAATTFSAQKAINSISTVIAVIGAQRSGGHLMGNGSFSCWCRNNDADMGDGAGSAGFQAGLIQKEASSTDFGLMPREEVRAYLDGARANVVRGYDRPGYQVVAFNGLGNPMQYLGASSNTRYGGMRIGECLIFNRHLKEDEVRSVCAYLEKKWFGCDTPYYKSAGTEAPDALNIRADGDSQISVKEGTVRVKSLVANATLTKVGAGTLEVVSSDAAAGTGEIVVREGRVVAVRGTDVATKAQKAVEPAFAVDPSDGGTIEYATGGEGTVRIVHASNGRHAMYQLTQNRQPKLETVDTCNGLSTLDFNDSTQKAMFFSRSFDAVRSAYVVWKPITQGANVLGCSVDNGDAENSKFLEYWRDDNASHAEKTYFKDQFGLLGGADIRTNGVEIATKTVPAMNEYQLVEVHTKYPTHVSALGAAQGGYQGGAKYGEVLLYERELTDREKIATRNYLLKKWFGKSDDELEDLPDAPTEVVLPGNLAFADGAALTVTRRDDGTVEPIASVSGTLSFGRNLTLNLAGFDPERDLGTRFVIAHAAEYAGLDDLKAATVTGLEIPAGCTLKFRATVGGDLVMKLVPDGTLLLVR